MRQRQAIFVVVLVALASAGKTAHAQGAWVGDTGALDLSLDYNLGISSKVVCDDTCGPGGADEFPDGGTTTHQFTIGAEYTPIQSLAVTLSVPIVMLKYTGDKTMYMHPAGGSYDDGDLHTTLTDLRAGARYQVLDEPVAIAPHLAFSIPLADYETIGNTVAGRHLKMAHAGIGVGKILGEATYLHLLYEFTLAEKYDETEDTAKHSQNRSDLAFTVGHKLMDFRLDIHADLNVRRTHGGVNFSEFAGLSMSEQDFHDAILDEDLLLAGGGVGYQVTNALNVSLSARIFLSGVNTQNASVFALGLEYSPL
ncbi:MAG TPA: hypothetical protein VIU61_22725 [Kofleriaceae bacterium]